MYSENQLKDVIKEEVAKTIKKRFKGIYIAKEVGISPSYVSLILDGKKSCAKRTAFCFTKVIDKDAEIDDYFERI